MNSQNHSEQKKSNLLKKRIVNPTFGADIEVFLMHRQTKEIVSAEPFIKGTKHDPFNWDKTNKFFAVSLDNVLAEFCIPPVTDKEAFRNYIKRSLDYLNQTVPDYLCTSAIPSAFLDEKYLQTDNAKLFGCDPDFNVWERGVNEKPKASNATLRSAGGHIHIGYVDSEGNEPSLETNELLIKAMDLCVGVPSVLQEPENERKKLYGKAGAFRFKPYGVEYRTVSNYYAGDDRLTDWVYEASENAVNLVNAEFPFDDYADRIIQSINNNDKVVAGNLIRELDLQLA